MDGPLIVRKGTILTDNIENYPSGIIIPVDKPYRWTSADVIRKVKFAACRYFHNKHLKVGHAGTLDPLATGVLLVCIGKATRLAETLQKHEKQYLAGVSFGATTASYDLEKEIDRRYPVDGIDEASVRKMLETFLGEQEQIAPLFSAKSVDGIRAYELARKEYKSALKNGTAFDHAASGTLARQHITISSLELISFKEAGDNTPIPLSYTPEKGLSPNPHINLVDTSGESFPKAEILVTCSKGTYIRALARDFGEALGSGAHLHSLRRTRTGQFIVSEALGISDTLNVLSSVKDNL